MIYMHNVVSSSCHTNALFKKKHFYSYLLFFIVSLCVIVQEANNITTAVDKYSWGCDEKIFCQENIFMIFFFSQNKFKEKKIVTWLGRGWREGKSKYINRVYNFSIWWCLKVTFLPRIACTTKESFPLVNCGSVLQKSNFFLLDQIIEVYHLTPQTNYNLLGYTVVWTSPQGR